jgi:hypothetical protein
MMVNHIILSSHIQSIPDRDSAVFHQAIQMLPETNGIPGPHPIVGYEFSSVDQGHRPQALPARRLGESRQYFIDTKNRPVYAFQAHKQILIDSNIFCINEGKSY